MHKVKAKGATVWTDIPEMRGTCARLSSDDLMVTIVPSVKSKGAGTLTNLIAKPDRTNAAEPHFFKRVFKILFSSDPVWKRKPAHYIDHVWQYQLHLLKMRHCELVRAGREKKDVHAYVWHALCAAHAS